MQFRLKLFDKGKPLKLPFIYLHIHLFFFHLFSGAKIMKGTIFYSVLFLTLCIQVLAMPVENSGT